MKKILILLPFIALCGCMSPAGAGKVFQALKDDPAEITIMSPYFSITRKMPANWVPPARTAEAPTVHVITRTNAPAQ